MERAETQHWLGRIFSWIEGYYGGASRVVYAHLCTQLTVQALLGALMLSLNNGPAQWLHPINLD
jgi:hypothetical protein